LAISRRHIGPVMRNLERRWRITCRYRLRDQNCNIWKFKIADGAILKIALSPYLSCELSDFDQICYTNADCHSEDRRLIYNRNFANSRWRTDAILKIVFGYISAPYWPSINQNCNFRKFKMADGRHFENSIMSISQLWIRFRSNLVHRCRLPFRGWTFDI